MNIPDVRPITPEDYEWIISTLRSHWGSEKVVSRGRIYNAGNLPGFMICREGKPSGLLTYQITNRECEIITLNSLEEGSGAGSLLLRKIIQTARRKKCWRLWLITTNDNIDALRFYQKRGFCLVAVHRNAIDHSRRLKPEIPSTGNYGIPLRDEIELEIKF